MTLIEIFIILIIHWIADFWLQTDKQAKGKSKNWNDLLSHTGCYTVVWYIVLVIISVTNNHILHYTPAYFGWDWRIVLFFPITFVCHTITDYFTSRLNSKLWQKGEVHYFFVAIGGDQILHYIQLFLTYQLLKS